MKKVTVLMTTYNEEPQILETAILSILNQTYKDFYFLVVVDNPENHALINVLKEYEKKDARISIIINKQNLGLALSLNKGINLVKTEYIARMDADDIAEKHRLESQLKYMEFNRNVSLIGSNILYMAYNSDVMKKRESIPTGFEDIRKSMKYVNVMHHPTFFGKTSVFKNYKYRNLKYAQDYDFICRLLEHNQEINNIDDCLLKYRCPLTKKSDKVVEQTITYHCIQKYYRKKKLNDCDIINIIKNKLKQANYNRIITAINDGTLAVNNYKQKRFLKFLFYFIKSSFESRYQFRQNVNLIKYSFIKKHLKG